MKLFFWAEASNSTLYISVGLFSDSISKLQKREMCTTTDPWCQLYKRIWPSSLTSSSETTISMQLMSFISERYKKVTLESDTTHHVGVYPVGITRVPWTTDVLMSFLNILLIVYGGHNSAEEEKPLAFSQCLQKVVWLCWHYINIPERFLNKLSKKSWLQKLNNFWLSVIHICENWLFITKLLTFHHQQQKLTLPRVVRKNRICKEK